MRNVSGMWEVRSSFVRLAATVLLLGCVLVTSGCSPPTVGVVGIGVNGSGALVGYLTVCDGSLDDALLYVPDGPVLGSWRAAAPVRDSASWHLASPTGWTATQPFRGPRSRVEMVLTAGSSDGSGRAFSVTFRMRDVESLLPGEVLYGDALNGFRQVSEPEFRAHACEWI